METWGKWGDEVVSSMSMSTSVDEAGRLYFIQVLVLYLHGCDRELGFDLFRPR